MLPSFVILGAQKSGTTFLHHCLVRHPRITMPAAETRFFQDPYWTPDPAALAGLFPDLAAGGLAGIVRPDYLGRPECPERIASMLPEARLVAVLRDPVERAVSAYYHLMKFDFLPLCPLEEGLARILDGEWEARWPKSREILEYGFHHRNLSRYLAHFPSDRLLCLRFEELDRRPARALSRVLRFLGLDDAGAEALVAPRDESNRGIYAPARLALTRLRSRLWYAYDAERTRFELDPSKPRALRWAGNVIDLLDEEVLARLVPNQKEALSPGLRARLSNLYRDDLERLEALLGWDLSAWRVGPEGEGSPVARGVATLSIAGAWERWT